MKARPILFSAPMVRALLEGRKGQTRRILKGSTEFRGPYNPAYVELHQRSDGWANICPYGQPGDLLWVRETWAPCGTDNPGETIALFRATEPDELGEITWKPSIHMPRWASRLTLEITGVRVERLQDISHEDAFAEGAPPPDGAYSRKDSFMLLWESINGPSSWATNPWVWCLTFQVHRCNVDELLKARAA